MLLRELAGGDPPYTCKLIFRDDPAGFGHRVTDGGRVVEHVVTQRDEYDRAVAELVAAGFAETERSLTRLVFATTATFWIVVLDGNSLRTQFGGLLTNWQESSGRTKDRLFRDRDRAVAAYDRAIEDKRAEGYRELYGRAVSLPAVPTAPKEPGTRGSR